MARRNKEGGVHRRTASRIIMRTSRRCSRLFDRHQRFAACVCIGCVWTRGVNDVLRSRWLLWWHGKIRVLCVSDVVRAGPWGSSLCGHLPGMQAERTLLNAGKTLWERGSEASVVAEERHHTPHKPLLGCMRWATHMLGGFGNPPKTLKMCGLRWD